MTTYREEFQPRIAEVIERVGTSDMRRLRSELRKAFPMVDRKYWPYKVWCNEWRRQLGLVKPRKPKRSRAEQFSKADPNQKHLFK